MPKILHIATDEKFINAANYLYEKAFPNSNDFFIILPRQKNYKIKHVSRNKNYFFFQETNKNLKTVCSRIDQYDIIIFHGFNFFKAKIVHKKPDAIYNWILWGAEVYSWHKSLNQNLYGKETKQLYKKESANNILRPFYHFLKYGKFNIFSYQLNTLKKLNYLSVLHKEDFDLFLKNKVINENTKYSKFTYYPIEFIFKNNKDLHITDQDILIGNSAHYSGNHLEIFEILKNINLKERKIIAPLSYGNKRYANVIINLGNQFFGENFNPLTEFMPLNEYNKTIQSCGIVIMNHYRQEAVGNILSSMWMGAKVFLDTKNTFYHYLKRIGCYVFSTNEITEQNLTNLTSKQIEHNRQILLQEIGTENIVKTIQKDIISAIA